MEMMTVLAMIIIITGIALFNFRGLRNPQNASAMEIMSFIKQARSKAVASTQAYTVSANSITKIIAKYSASCSSGNLTTDPLMVVNLPHGASLQNTTWTVCFEARGFSRSAVNIVVTQDGVTKTVQVVLGGAVRVI